MTSGLSVERPTRRRRSSSIEERVAKAAHELTYAPLFDRVLTNDDLERCYGEFYSIVSAFLSED